MILLPFFVTLCILSLLLYVKLVYFSSSKQYVTADTKAIADKVIQDCDNYHKEALAITRKQYLAAIKRHNQRMATVKRLSG